MVKISTKECNRYQNGEGLILAADSGHNEVVEFLVGTDGNNNVSRRQRFAALMKAAINGHVAVIGTLMSTRSVENWRASESNRIILTMAAQYGHAG